MNTLINAAGVAMLAMAFLGIAGSPLAIANEHVSCSSPSPTRTTCRIDEPTVTRRLTEYPQITFRPGDLVTVQAGGCVQTGGIGRTWKRYVNPSGDNSDRLYHGLIQLPGAHSDLVRIAGVILHPITIPAVMDPNHPGLRLGYEDDGYGDNGYSGHDDGTENQCRNVGNAFVMLTIDRGPAKSPDPAPFDLVIASADPNVFPINPKWGWQRLHPGALPNADTQCFTLPGVFSNPACSTQSPSLDIPDGFNAVACAIGAQHNIHGHVNWMPATWQGTISWDGHSSSIADDDYNINLVPPNAEGLTVSSGGHIHAEFDSDETIDHFRTPWWQSFHEAVDRDDASARAMIDGKFAIVIGLAGLDCEHGCATELHPVYGLAVHVNDNPEDDTWAVFVRNSGNEGYCSQDNHLLDTDRMAFFIPRAGASAVRVNTASTFLTNNSDASGPAVSLSAGFGAIVAFGLPAPEKAARINGELHLQWTTSAGALTLLTNKTGMTSGALATLASGGSAEVRAAPQMLALPPPEVEERLQELQKQLPEGARQATSARLARTQLFDATTPKALSAVPPPPARRAAVRAVVDPIKGQRDLQRAQSICNAFSRSVPGIPGACAAVPQ